MFSINSCIYKGERTYHRPLVPKNLQRLADWIIEVGFCNLQTIYSPSQLIQNVGRRRAYLKFHICTCNHNEFKTFHKFQGILSQLFFYCRKKHRQSGNSSKVVYFYFFDFFAVHEYIWSRSVNIRVYIVKDMIV